MRKVDSHCCVTLPISVAVRIGEAPRTLATASVIKGADTAPHSPTAVSVDRSGRAKVCCMSAPARGAMPRWRRARGAAGQTFGSDPNANPIETA